MSKKVKLAAVFAASALFLAACGGDNGNGGDGDGDGNGGGGGGERTMRLAFNQTDNHPQYIAMAEASERLEEATDGALSIQIYPNETLGAQQEAIQLLQDNSLELAYVGGAQLENFSDDFIVFNLPYIFESQDHQRHVTNDPDIIGELYTSLEDNNIRVIGGFHGGVRNVYNSVRPVVTPDDMSGLNIRVQESDTHIEMMNLMGGSGTPMAQGEVYTAIQTGVLDGGENNELVYVDLQQLEVAEYYSYTRHLMVPDYLIINPTVYSELGEHQEAFDEAMAWAVQREAELWDEKVAEAIETAEAAGAQFNEVDFEAFAEILVPFSEQSVPDSELAQALYQAAQDSAADF